MLITGEARARLVELRAHASGVRAEAAALKTAIDNFRVDWPGAALIADHDAFMLVGTSRHMDRLVREIDEKLNQK